MFRGPLFKPYAWNEWRLMNRVWKMIAMVRTAAHTLRLEKVESRKLKVEACTPNARRSSPRLGVFA